ncbi:MAG: FAD-dependent oxidoreductase [Myxococcales bacterium]|nr:FAD-dependent oxidoreductase [Myxococcales bacterium]
MSRRASARDPLAVVEVDVHPDTLGDPEELRRICARAAGIPLAEARALELRRRSIDARRGRVRIHVEAALLSHLATREAPAPRALRSAGGAPRAVIVGAGPAGLFAAWGLALAGVRSLILERGKAVRPRRADLAALSQRGELDPESNYCFGEGGAGTFSDGKLYTRATKRGPVRAILEALAAYGAAPEILVDARPHIGTNRLPRVITAMREDLASAGVELRFGARVDGLVRREGRVVGVELADGQRIDAEAVVLAPGHSARDVFRWLRAAGVELAFKPYAMGVRIEHGQPTIDRIQYGELAGHPALGAAYYRLVERPGGVGVFSFCMCPGGHIVPAATEPGMQVVNGMSPHHRRGRFANSGFVTEVGPELLARAGLDPGDPLAGLAFQATLEARAYEAGGGAFVAPGQTLRDLAAGTLSRELPPTSYHRGLAPARLDLLLGELGPPIQAALTILGRRMPGFVSDQAVAVGVESRTSSPVRIVRDPATLAAVRTPGLYPSGEGAGFAGGIVSAAVDGLRVAAAIARELGAETGWWDALAADEG